MSVPFSSAISVIIPVKRDDPFIERCLSALMKAIDPACQVIVVLDGWETDRLEQFMATGQASVFSHAPAGPAACRHFGALQAVNPWLCFLDSDVLVYEETFTKALQHLCNSGDDGLVGSYDEHPESSHIVSRFRNLLHHYHHQRNHGMSGVFWGAFGMVRRTAYFDVGGFDPAFRSASVEDIELGYRLAAGGYVVSIRREVQVCHLKRWNLMNMIRTDIWLRARPWTLLMYRYRRWNQRPLNTSAREQASAAFACITSLSLVLILLTKWGLVCFISSLLFFLFAQFDFYRFVFRHFSPVRIPQVIALHHIYFCSAVTGWMLAFVARASEQKQIKHG
jgi:cellulose synthase/poly-beta-1,6-N-acetylglucosamine synthase-like glycosyltransferase